MRYIKILFFILVLKLLPNDASKSASIKTEGGNLVLEAAEGKSIYLKSGDSKTAAIYVNDFNLIPLVSQLSGKPAANENNNEITDETDNSIIKRLDKIEEQLAAGNFSSGLQNNSTVSDRGLRLLRTKVARLTRQVTSLQSQFSTLVNLDFCKSGPCQHGGKCINVFNGYFCICPSNWEGKNCDVDVNECYNFAGTELGCQNGASCINKLGGYECACVSGWHGIHCTKRANDCSPGDREMCGNGKCIPSQTGLGYSCICDQGWMSNGTSPACLSDVDECVGGKHHCSKNPAVRCINTPGSYTCGPCPQGYSGDGFQCSDIDECQSNNGGCSTNPLVSCYNTVGSRICAQCPAGFQGDGTSCTWRGSCRINNGGCHPSATCIENNVGGGVSVQCSCPSGTEGDGFGVGGCRVTSSNVTTCASNPCLHGNCYDVAGGFTCVCHQGYSGARCNQRNSDSACKTHRCQNGATCVPRASPFTSDYTCRCPPDYVGTFCDLQMSICGEIVNNTRGNLTFPSTKAKYSGNIRCAFVIETIPEKVLNITFTKFQLEYSEDCSFDFLQIHDGRRTASPLLGRFCGNVLPNNGSIISTHNNLYFWFRSDPSVHGEGFSMQWESITPQCGQEINVTSHGTLSSPGSPGNYPANRDCIWVLRAPLRKRILLQFFSIDFENHPNCSYDYLAIFDGETESEPLLKRYCNKTIPEPLQSSSAELLIHFHSDAYDSGKGFQLTYSLVEGVPGCGGTYSEATGEITPPKSGDRYLDNLSCDYAIRVKEGFKILLTVSEFRLSGSFSCSSDYVKIFDGPSSQSKLFGTFCRDEIPKQFESSGNTMYIQFRSDARFNFGGFKFNYKSVCKHELRALQGVITSPNYPKDAEFGCEYSIMLPPKKAIKLQSQEFAIDTGLGGRCENHYLAVYDGSDAKAPLLGRYCSANKLPMLISTQNHLYLKLKLLLIVAKEIRFILNYTSIDLSCGGIYTESPGNISYDVWTSQQCTWILSAPAGRIVEVSDVHLTGRRGILSECTDHYLTFIDVDGRNEDAAKFCGRQTLPLIHSQTNKFRVTLNVTTRSFAILSFSYKFVNSEQFCGGQYVNPTGVLHSPNWPDRYPNNRDCKWSIKLHVGQQIRLKVKYFLLEESMAFMGDTCQYTDILEIRNGLTDKSPLQGVYCVNKIPSVITSSTNALYVHFKSDVVIKGHGFEIEWEGVATGCGGKLTGYMGEIMSPNYPQSNEMVECFWRISTSAGSKLQIWFKDIDLPFSCPSKREYVQIFDGESESSPALSDACDSATLTQSSAIETSGNNAFVKYHSSDILFHSKRGFHLQYSTMGQSSTLLNVPTFFEYVRNTHCVLFQYWPGCNMNLTGFRGIVESLNFPESYPNSINCSWTINVLRGNRIKIHFTHMISYYQSAIIRGSSNCSSVRLEITDKDSKQIVCNTDILAKPFLSQTNTVNVAFINPVDEFIEPPKRFRFEWELVGCGGKLSNSRGKVSLPQNVSLGNDLECVWEISAEFGKRIVLSVLEVNLKETANCTEDHVIIFDGADQESALISFCHNMNNYKVNSRSNKMIVKLRSSYVLKKFQATYRTETASCGGSVSGGSGYITSPNYPHNYDNDVVCEWTINMDEMHSVRLDIVEMDLDASNGCNDSLTIDVGVKNKTVLCGDQGKNTTLVSRGNVVDLQFKSDQVGAAKGFKIKYSTSCGGLIKTNGEGILKSSPLTASGFDGNCTWVISSDRLDRKIYITITQLDIPKALGWISVKACPGGYLRIYEGENVEAPLIGEYCGSKLPSSIVSKSNSVTVQMGSYLVPYRGKFALHYSVLDSGCGGELTSFSGEIATPNYPQGYPMGIDCEWILKPSPGNKVSLSFDSFALEESENCNQDYLEIRNGTAAGKVLGVYCGNDIPMDVTSVPQLYLRFHSDANGTAKGFIANYEYEHGISWNSPSGAISSPMYPELYDKSGNFTWSISTGEVQSYFLIKVTELVIESESCDDNYLMIYDGADQNMPMLKSLCGSITEDVELKTTTTEAYIVFVIANVINGNKFSLEWTTNTGHGKDKVCSYNATRYIEPMKSLNITSPKEPDFKKDCEWMFLTDPGYHLRIKFTYFAEDYIYYRPNCNDFYLEIFSGVEGKDEWRAVSDKVCANKSLSYETTHLMKVQEFAYSYHSSSFKAVVTSECGGIVQSSSGVIELREGATDVGGHCEWIVKVRKGRKMKFQFETFNVGDKDCISNVVIRNGESADSPVMSKYCGLGKIPQTDKLVTFSSSMYIRYEAGIYWTLQKDNFRLHFEEQNFECGFTSTLDSFRNNETIMTPKYPDVPPPYSECVWTVVAPPGETIDIVFDNDRFDLDCESESLVVRDGGTPTSELLEKFCSKPENLITTSNSIYVQYMSNAAEPHNGFKAVVSIHDCGGTLRENRGVVEWDGRSLKTPLCRWKIKIEGAVTIYITRMSLPRSKVPCDTNVVISDNLIDGLSKTYCNANESLDILLFKEGLVNIDLSFSGATNYDPNAKYGFRIEYNITNTFIWRRSCGFTTEKPSGIIGYDAVSYSGFNLCSWTIQAPKFDRRIKLEILKFNLTGDDELTITESNMHVGTKLGPNSTQRVIKSSGGYLNIRLQFSSDRPPLFKARYTSEEPALCSGLLVGKSGVITQPETNETDRIVCKWKKEDAYDSTIILKITFEINGTTDNNAVCYRSTSTTINYPSGFEIFCTTVYEATKVFSGPSFTITYNQNSLPAKLRIQWRIEDKCGGKIGSIDGNELALKMPSTEANKTIDCTWWLRLSYDYPIKISANGSFAQDCSSQYIKLYRRGFTVATYCQGREPTSPVVFEYFYGLVVYHAAPGDNNSSIALNLERQGTNSCGGELKVTSYSRVNTFSTPHYPQSYDPNLKCTWNIKAETGERVQLNFTGRFNVETATNCTKDVLIVYDYRNGEYREKARLCGRDTPQPITSSENKMRLVLTTDDHVNGEGFQASLGSVCGGVFEASDSLQYIQSPSYPSEWHGHINCTYTIGSKSKDSENIFLTFEDFYIFNNFIDTCDRFSIKIDEVQYCRSTNKPVPAIYFREIKIHLQSESSVIRFKGAFRLEKCGGKVNKSGTIIRSHSDSVKEHPNNLACSWEIVAPANKIIVLRFLSLDVENLGERQCFDSVDVYDDLDAAKSLASLCGNYTVSLPTVRSTGNKMLVKFTTDLSRAKNGFKAEILFTQDCGSDISLSADETKALNSPTPVEGETLDCEWSISAPEDYVVHIEWQKVDIARCDDAPNSYNTKTCACDFVEIKENDHFAALTIVRYCGKAIPTGLSSANRVMLLRLHAKSHSSFSAGVSARRGVCGQSDFNTMNATQSIESPGFAAKTLSRGLHCNYILSTDKSYYNDQIYRLNFKLIDLDPSDKLYIFNQDITKNRSRDVTVNLPFFNQYEGSYYFELTSRHLMHTLSGQMRPLDLYLEGSITIKLITSASGSSRHAGFSLDVTKLDGETCLNHTSSQGRIKHTPKGACAILITAPANKTITLYIQSFSNSNPEDSYIEVYDGSSKDAKLLHKYVLSSDIATVSSSGSNMLLYSKSRFYSDLFNDFYYVTTDKGSGCGGEMFNYVGTLTSPNYPAIYRNNVQCEWNIETLANTKLVLRFTILDLGSNSLRSEVYVKLVDRKGNTVATYGGDDEPTDFKSADNFVKVVYKSSLNAQGTGWRAQFIGVIPDGYMEDSALLDEEFN